MSTQDRIYGIKVFLLYCCLLTMVCGFLGCDAFVRKFTRKPKKEELPQEEMVLAPEEYKGPQMTKEELYRQYFLFWKSWQAELIESLINRRSQKKQVDCAQEAIKNLINLRELLNEQAKKKLDIYIGQLEELKGQISSDLYGNNISINLRSAESMKMNILKDFSQFAPNNLRSPPAADP